MNIHSWPVVGAVDHYLDEWWNFDTGNIYGLVSRPTSETLDILSINAHEQNKGHATTFIAGCQREYTTIRVFAVLNHGFGKWLRRHGFKPKAIPMTDGTERAMVWNSQRPMIPVKQR